MGALLLAIIFMTYLGTGTTNSRFNTRISHQKSHLKTYFALPFYGWMNYLSTLRLFRQNFSHIRTNRSVIIKAVRK